MSEKQVSNDARDPIEPPKLKSRFPIIDTATIHRILEINRVHGFSFTFDEIPKAIALMHSELSEALENHRSMNERDIYDIVYKKSDKPCGFTVELADCIIRILHLVGEFDLPIQEALERKIAYNERRSYKHGRSY